MNWARAARLTANHTRDHLIEALRERQAEYDPSIFTHVTSLGAAKRIILTDERDLNTEQRWERETPHICDLIEKQVELNENKVVLDFGCGVGRIAKELIARHGCWVIGADISPNMLGLAQSYVGSAKFITCNPKALAPFEMEADLVMAVWVLQHVEDLGRELYQIKTSMRRGAQLFVVNEGGGRFVPTSRGWNNDNINVRAELTMQFDEVASGHLDPAVVGEEQSQRTFWATYRI